MTPSHQLAVLVDKIARDIAAEVYGFGSARRINHYSSESIEHQHQKIARVAVESFLRHTVQADPIINDAESIREMLLVLTGKKL